MARHISNYEQQSLQIFLDLLNHDNNKKLTIDDINIGLPFEYNGNTGVAITSKYDNVLGEVIMEYRRVPLDVLPTLSTNVEPILVWTPDYTGVLNEINYRYKLNLTTSDVLFEGNEVLTPHGREVGTVFDIVIQAKPDSYVWAGQCTFSVSMQGEPFEDRPEGALIKVTEKRDIRATTDGSIRIFKI